MTLTEETDIVVCELQWELKLIGTPPPPVLEQNNCLRLKNKKYPLSSKSQVWCIQMSFQPLRTPPGSSRMRSVTARGWPVGGIAAVQIATVTNNLPDCFAFIWTRCSSIVEARGTRSLISHLTACSSVNRWNVNIVPCRTVHDWFCCLNGLFHSRQKSNNK